VSRETLASRGGAQHSVEVVETKVILPGEPLLFVGELPSTIIPAMSCFELLEDDGATNFLFKEGVVESASMEDLPELKRADNASIAEALFRSSSHLVGDSLEGFASFERAAGIISSQFGKVTVLTIVEGSLSTISLSVIGIAFVDGAGRDLPAEVTLAPCILSCITLAEVITDAVSVIFFSAKKCCTEW
jgi:hypothetical protein